MSETLETPSDYADHFKPVSIGQLNRMVKNYKDAAKAHDETESVWFSIYHLMALIGENKANGIRIYYGRHDKDDKLYPGRNTVILVATRDSKTPGNPCCDDSFDLLDLANDNLAEEPDTFAGNGMDMAPLCPPRCKPRG